MHCFIDLIKGYVAMHFFVITCLYAELMQFKVFDVFRVHALYLINYLLIIKNKYIGL
jgi:hypothetical protein